MLATACPNGRLWNWLSLHPASSLKNFVSWRVIISHCSGFSFDYSWGNFWQKLGWKLQCTMQNKEHSSRNPTNTMVNTSMLFSLLSALKTNSCSPFTWANWLPHSLGYKTWATVLSFKVDSQDVKVGGLVIECCRQLQAFTLSLYPFSPKSRQRKPPSNCFLAGCRVLMRALLTFGKNQSEALKNRCRSWKLVEGWALKQVNTNFILTRKRGLPFQTLWCMSQLLLYSLEPSKSCTPLILPPIPKLISIHTQFFFCEMLNN